MANKVPAGLPLRRLAADKLKTVLGGEAFSPFSVAEIPEGRDRALANRLVTTALRRQGQLDVMIGDLLDKGMPKKSGSFEAVLRLSLAQLLFLPDLGAHSALYLAGEAMKADKKAQHLVGLMNAVLRSAQGKAAQYWDMPGDLLFPQWLAESWRTAYGDVIPDFAEALLAGAPLDLTLKAPDDEQVEVLGATPVFADTVRLETRDRPVEALPGYAEGEWWVQDVASAIPARLLGLPTGSRVLDLCAAPGGKTAQLLKAGYQVTAVDADAMRVRRLADNLARLKMSADLVTANAASYRADPPFDGVLLDAPCSATGIFRRHPEVLWHRDPADIVNRVAIQQQLLTSAVLALRPGGILIYCVCSLQPEEGEWMAKWAAKTLQRLESYPIAPQDMPGFEQAVTRAGFVRTHPALPLPEAVAGGLDGFFVARFRKTD